MTNERRYDRLQTLPSVHLFCIAATDREIDRLACELYGLTDE